MNLGEFLAYCRCEQYYDAFEDAGWDDVPYLLSLTPEELCEVTSQVGMKVGHAQKLLHIVAALKCETEHAPGLNDEERRGN